MGRKSHWQVSAYFHPEGKISLLPDQPVFASRREAYAWVRRNLFANFFEQATEDPWAQSVRVGMLLTPDRELEGFILETFGIWLVVDKR